MWALVSSLSCVVSTQVFGGYIGNVFTWAGKHERGENEQNNRFGQGNRDRRQQVAVGQQAMAVVVEPFAPAVEAQLNMEGLIVNELEQLIAGITAGNVRGNNNDIVRLRRLITDIEQLVIANRRARVVEGFSAYRQYSPEELALIRGDNLGEQAGLDRVVRMIGLAARQVEQNYWQIIQDFETRLMAAIAEVAVGGLVAAVEEAVERQPLRHVEAAEALLQMRLLLTIEEMVQRVTAEIPAEDHAIDPDHPADDL